MATIRDVSIFGGSEALCTFSLHFLGRVIPTDVTDTTSYLSSLLFSPYSGLVFFLGDTLQILDCVLEWILGNTYCHPWFFLVMIPVMRFKIILPSVWLENTSD